MHIENRIEATAAAAADERKKRVKSMYSMTIGCCGLWRNKRNLSERRIEPKKMIMHVDRWPWFIRLHTYKFKFHAKFNLQLSVIIKPNVVLLCARARGLRLASLLFFFPLSLPPGLVLLIILCSLAYTRIETLTHEEQNQVSDGH